MRPTASVIGAVLCGGRSSRMGVDKASMPYRGVPMARRVADALGSGGCGAVVAIGGDSRLLGLDTIPDVAPGEGPLGGVVTLLQALEVLEALDDDGTRPTGALVVPCDLPLLDVATVSALVGRSARGDVELVVATTDRLEPLVAVWSLSALDTARRSFLAGERSIRRVVPLLDVALVPVSAAAVHNVNTPAELPD